MLAHVRQDWLKVFVVPVLAAVANALLTRNQFHHSDWLSWGHNALISLEWWTCITLTASIIGFVSNRTVCCENLLPSYLDPSQRRLQEARSRFNQQVTMASSLRDMLKTKARSWDDSLDSGLDGLPQSRVIDLRGTHGRKAYKYLYSSFQGRQDLDGLHITSHLTNNELLQIAGLIEEICSVYQHKMELVDENDFVEREVLTNFTISKHKL
ncbi:hypothetical protein VKT23_018345 [Stygiomarasmius scandens]|uniref:Uncharacterized protein n=1 Tax=Marasmiellus scandens TaxID=2682957 RepID=A0ABR1ITR7_9AGAR